MNRHSAFLITLCMGSVAAFGRWHTVVAAEETKPISIDLPRWNLHDALEQLAKRTGAEVVADAYAKPRPQVATANTAGKPFRLQASSLEKVLDQLCAIFGYQWTKDGNVYLLRNKYPHLDEPYQVSDAVRQKAEAVPQAATFKHLADFLDVKQEWIEALAEQRPHFVMLSEKSPRRREIAFYARLPEALRVKLDKGEKVPYSEFPKEIRDQVLAVAKEQWKGITPEQITKFVYRLITDPRGWQHLETLNLPTTLPTPKKSR